MATTAAMTTTKASTVKMMQILVFLVGVLDSLDGSIVAVRLRQRTLIAGVSGLVTVVGKK